MKKNIWIAASLFLLALLTRLIYLFQIKDTPLFGFFAADSYFYDKFAREILKGNWASREMIYFNPLYPFFLSIVYRLFGYGPFSVGFFQAAIDAGTCVLLYLVCEKIFSAKTIGITASLVYAFYGIAIFYTGFLLDATLSVFLAVCLIFILIDALKKGLLRLWFFGGLVFGLCVLLRPNAILFVPFLFVWLYSNKKINIRKSTLAAVLVVAGFLIALLPFSIRNYFIDGSVSPFSVSGGLIFYIGNHPGATGSYSPIEGISNAPLEQEKQSIAKARRETGKQLTPLEANRYWFLRGLLFIKQSPRKYFTLILKKLYLFWNRREHSINVNFYFCKQFLPIMNLPFFSFGVVAPFALIGLLLSFGEKRKELSLIFLFILANVISLILVFVTSRYRFLSIPFLIIAASYGARRLFIYLKAERSGSVIIALIAVMVFSFAANVDMPFLHLKDSFPKAHLNLAYAYYNKGMLQKAIDECKKALAIEPEHAETLTNLGGLYYERGMFDEAIAEFRCALRIDPKNVQALSNLGVAYYDKSMFDKAITEYRKALAINPYQAQVRYNIANAFRKKGELKQAIREYYKTLEIDPDFASAHLNLAYCYFRLKRHELVDYHFKKALSLDPSVRFVFPGNKKKR